MGASRSEPVSPTAIKGSHRAGYDGPVELELEDPHLTLAVDEAPIVRAMAEAAAEIMRGKSPTDSGEFVESITAEVLDELAEVGPTGTRNEIIARMLKRRGVDVTSFTAGERAQIVQAGQREVERQIAAGNIDLRKG